MSFLPRVGLQDTDQLSQKQKQNGEKRREKKRLCFVPVLLSVLDLAQVTISQTTLLRLRERV